ncbi:NAD-dependent epimerase/dehydratase family protein [Usitatibacter palustris]|uniref:Uronate dehydrogenase n=1 Tax=Usitatibacter palustris TaxID=2732487 RepID=A0A6M4H608_9PROT|nr:NAD(P)-dependent oxidoreductase [Usitatibacter palustris]QJR14625.1 Uronate dehydrogenase [Usitatibacter palustris]
MNDARQEYRRILLTGAAGGLGKVLREGLKPFASVLRVSDRVDIGTAKTGEEVVLCELGDKAAVHRLVEDCDAVVHFGGVSVETNFDPILEANIVGLFNVYEAMRKHGVKRAVFASSNHVTGFYKQADRIDADDPVRPDGLYGVSKCFGENLSRFYFDRYGIETACLRIGSSFPEPKDRRMLATYLSYADLIELVRRALFAPKVGHTVIFGASDNKVTWWDNAKAEHIGFKPRDTSEVFRARVEAAGPPLDPSNPVAIFQGGAFVTAGPFDD